MKVQTIENSRHSRTSKCIFSNGILKKPVLQSWRNLAGRTLLIWLKTNLLKITVFWDWRLVFVNGHWSFVWVCCLFKCKFRVLSEVRKSGEVLEGGASEIVRC